MVWLEPHESEAPTIQLGSDVIAIYADVYRSMVWHNDRCIHYLGEKDVPPPEPPGQNCSDSRQANEYARGWIALYNSLSDLLNLYVEPWGVNVHTPLPPQGTFHIRMEPYLYQDGSPDIPGIQFSPEGVSIYVECETTVIWHNGECVYHFGEGHVAASSAIAMTGHLSRQTFGF